MRCKKSAHFNFCAKRLIPIFEAHGPNRYLRARKDLEPVQRKLFRDVILSSLMRIAASPIAPASSVAIADAADAVLLDVRREISIFTTSIVRRRNRAAAQSLHPVLSERLRTPHLQDRTSRRAIVLVVPAAAAPYRASGLVL